MASGPQAASESIAIEVLNLSSMLSDLDDAP